MSHVNRILGVFLFAYIATSQHMLLVADSKSATVSTAAVSLEQLCDH